MVTTSTPIQLLSVSIYSLHSIFVSQKTFLILQQQMRKKLRLDASDWSMKSYHLQSTHNAASDGSFRVVGFPMALISLAKIMSFISTIDNLFGCVK